jgi:LysM repeat protein
MAVGADAARLKQGSSVMTRENKLVMVIGFGFLLFLGILVSDHLAANTTPLKQELVKYEIEPDALPGENKPFGTVALPIGPIGLPRDEARIDIVRDGGFETSGVSNGIPGGQLNGLTGSEGATTGSMKERVHKLAKGEYPEDVALKYYKKRALGAKLAEYNKVNPSKLKIGQELKIPDIAVLDPSLAPKVESAGVLEGTGLMPEMLVQDTTTLPGEATPILVATPKIGTVKVGDGDTLFGIAKKVYGNGARWEEIAKLNKLDKRKTLQPGMEIKYALAE